MKIENDIKLDFDDVLIKPKRSTLKSRKDVDVTRTFKFKNSGKSWVGTPIMAANMDTTGTFEMSSKFLEYEMPVCIQKFYSLDQWKEFLSNHSEHRTRLFTIPSIGTNDQDFEKYLKLNSIFPYSDFVCIDVANGYGEYFVEFIEKFRSRFPDKTIIAGNVVSYEMTEQLVLSGADIVKVGIGSGSSCETRIKTGVGIPQFSAVVECADAAHGLGAHIISDGGCNTPGDVSKALGAGADFVMIGGMLAGHDESAGEIIEELWMEGYKWQDGGPVKNIIKKKYKKFYGMSSDTAQKIYYGEKKTYRASEGRTVKVPYRGPVENTIQEILGGIKSTCTYVGAPTLKQLSKCTTFIRVNNTHNRVYIDKEIKE